MENATTWTTRLDKTVVIAGSLTPVGIVIGSVAFEAAISLAVVSWMARTVLSPDLAFRKALKHPLILPLFCWYAVILASLVWNGPGTKGWGHDVVIIRFALFVLALIDTSHRKPVAVWMVYGLMFSVAFAAINAAAAYAFGHDLIGNPLIRYSGKLREAGRIANNCAYAAPFFIGWAMVGEGLGKRARWAICGVGLAAVVLLFQSKVRTACLAAATGLIILVLFQMRHKIPRRMAMGTIAAILITLGLFFEKINAWDFRSIYDRVYFWKVSWAMWTDHPILGVGVSAWRDIYQEFARSGAIEAFVAPDGSVWNATTQYHSHNLVLMLLSCTGISGLAVLGWLFLRMTKLALAHQTGFRASMVSWPVVFLGIGLTGSNIYSSGYFALFAVILACIGSGESRGGEKGHLFPPGKTPDRLG